MFSIDIILINPLKMITMTRSVHGNIVISKGLEKYTFGKANHEVTDFTAAEFRDYLSREFPERREYSWFGNDKPSEPFTKKPRRNGVQSFL